MSDESFHGSARFELRQRLGQGGMGVVYRAYDRERHMEVALKTLRHVDPTAIYRLKREFRALADVSHPNLATLYELIHDDDRWFFTMELVRGTNFIGWVRQASAFAEDSFTSEAIDATLIRRADEDDPGDPTEIDPPRPAASVVNLRRLRGALHQLAEGLGALHAAGRLHRDVKPSNVLVTENGRVVILDFGLVTELLPTAEKSATEQGRVIGTPAYMAPEQATDAALTPAADWYAVGIMLYEALTGRLPFPGSGVQQLLRKYSDVPLRPSAIAPATPEDLGTLTMRLLEREPEQRAGADEVFAIVSPDARAPSVARVAPRSEAARGSRFVGREAAFADLDRAFTKARAGQPMTVLVRGESGMGKTALVRHFVEEIEAKSEAVVLAGRCYEHESVPYKALDSFVDALSLYLRRLDRLEVEALLPRDVRALTKLFPVLERVNAIADAPAKRADIADRAELRRRAFRALKELLARISDRHPLIVHIDDLQWGDVDSASFLLDLMQPPEPPSMLLIGAFRDEDLASNALTSALLEAKTDLLTHRIALERPVVIKLGPLSPAESALLAKAELSDEVEDPDRLVERIAKEARGHPFLLESLARHAGRAKTGTSFRLQDLIEHRVGRLEPLPRRVLEIVCVAARPIPKEVALRAAGVQVEDESAALDGLRATNLVRTAGDPRRGTVEAYHDRVRETVVAGLEPATLSDRHRSLALTLEILHPNDAHALYVHFAGCDERFSAAQYALDAGDQAIEALAFDRAARMYGAALDLVPHRGNADRRALLVKRADALANAGRGREAAAAYLAAAELSPPTSALDCRRRASEQLLINGQARQGFEVLATVLEEIDLPLAESPELAYQRVLSQRDQLIARGLAFDSKESGDLDADALARIDVLATVAIGLSMIDTVRGADFQLRHLLAALDLGEPRRIAKALATEVMYASAARHRDEQRLDQLLSVATELSSRIRDRTRSRCATWRWASPTTSGGIGAGRRGSSNAPSTSSSPAAKARPGSCPRSASS